MLILDHNDHSEESLKHVYALLFADKKIIVQINNPKDNIKSGETSVMRPQI